VPGLAPYLRVLPWRTGLLTLVALALHFGAGPAPAGLVLDRAGVAGGEWWRLLTGHWVHSDADHALWNIAALAFLGALFERLLGGRLVAALALGMLLVDAWVLAGLPELSRYCGLSGILNALLATGLIALWRERSDPWIALVGAGAVLKIAAEAGLGQALFSSTQWDSVPAAHAAGLLAGLIVSMNWRWTDEPSVEAAPHSSREIERDPVTLPQRAKRAAAPAVRASASCPSRTDGSGARARGTPGSGNRACRTSRA
jgi:rhomboid family GlyGly-CTERM serine protease